MRISDWSSDVCSSDLTGEALTDSVADDIDELADDEMLHREFSADIHHRFGGDAELDDLALRLDIRLGEVAAHGLGHVLRLGSLDTDLKSGITVLLLGALCHHLAIVHLQHGDRHVRAVLREQPGHSQLACNQSGPHGPSPLTA